MSGLHDGTQHRHVVADVPMRLMNVAGDNAAVSAEFHYTTRDPYAVQATFHRANHAPVVWVFARELLLVGTARPVGEGDVQIRPDGEDLLLTLQSPEGSALLSASAFEIRRFATRMLGVVPAGGEASFVDVDAELAALDPAMFARGDL